MKMIKTVGVVGAGTMGSTLAQKFAQEGFPVILVDRAMNFIDKGLNNIKNTLTEGVERKVFTQRQADEILRKIKGADKLEKLAVCDLVVEAIFEEFKAKTELFETLSSIVPNDAILATNTSSFSVTELARSVSHPERFIGLHYFYHAAKNRLVEIVPGEKTSPDTFTSATCFSLLSGKDPITCKDSYGFVVNRFFVPWLNEAVRLLKEGVANIPTIDAVCMKTFGIGMGPFALMNATGIPIAYHSQKTLEQHFDAFYTVIKGLEEKAASGEKWVLENTPEEIPSETEAYIQKRMLGSVFYPVVQLLEEHICTAAAIERGARIGLRWKEGPISLIRTYGDEYVQSLLDEMTSTYKTKPLTIHPNLLELQYVDYHKTGNRGVIILNRPEDLNALNEELALQLSQQFAQAESDDSVEEIIITAIGKAFAAGADVKFFLNNMRARTLEHIVEFTRSTQHVFDRIDCSEKNVIVLVNGLALGGGLELALCADVLIVSPQARMGFPETGLGIYPALGGTYRTARRVGKPLARYLVLTGKMLSAHEAVEIGLADAVIPLEEMVQIIYGGKTFTAPTTTHTPGTKWADIAHLFSTNTLEQLLEQRLESHDIAQNEIVKVVAALNEKAPLALRFADKIISDGEGAESELAHLTDVFSSEDAMRGLSHIGKKVSFHGK